MKTYTAVIVEDSRLARNELKELLKDHKEINLIGEAENVDDGYKLINDNAPDLLFLDINMPEKDGFELLEMLDEVPTTIFTTAFDEYAIKSFEYNAFDYLLKPINQKRFSLSISKVLEEKIGNIVVFFEDNKPMIYKSLAQIEEKLPGDVFFRANRQQIININHVNKVVSWFNGKLKIEMNTGEEIEISRRQSYIFKDQLSF